MTVVIRRATFDADCVYRYRLTRIWDSGLAAITWIMLNPSTADEHDDDPTISRVIGFSRSWGYGSAEVVNLFAFRTPSPAMLQTADDPVGPANDETVLSSASRTDKVIVAWGNHGALANPVTGAPRCDEMLRMIDDVGGDVDCLGFTRSGQPSHPLYLPADTRPTSIHSAARQ